MKQQDLIGHWTLKRKIFNREYNLVGTIWGKVTFKKLTADELLYRESAWNISGETSQFLGWQIYFYRFEKKEVEIYRKGEKKNIPFLVLPYGKKVVHSHYLCKPDLHILCWVWINAHFFYTCFAVKGIHRDHIFGDNI